MNIGTVVFDISAGSTIGVGLIAMKNNQFHPIYLVFHLPLIIATAMFIGFLAETRYKNYKKNRHDRLGQRHL